MELHPCTPTVTQGGLVLRVARPSTSLWSSIPLSPGITGGGGLEREAHGVQSERC